MSDNKNRLSRIRSDDNSVMGAMGRIYSSTNAIQDRAASATLPQSHGTYVAGRGATVSYQTGPLDGAKSGALSTPLRLIEADLVGAPIDLAASGRANTSSEHFCIVGANGRVRTWGNGIGRNGGGNSYTLGTISGSGYVRASAGDACGAAVKSDGTLWSWGTGTAYRTGQNVTTASVVPVQIGAALGVSFVDVCLQGTVGYAITTTGAAYVWGNNASFGTGMGTSTGSTTVPTLCTGLSGKAVKMISGTAHGGGGGQFFAILTNGELWYTPMSASNWVKIGTATDWDWVSSGQPTGYAILRKTNGDYYGVGEVSSPESGNYFGSPYSGNATSPQKLNAVSEHGFTDACLTGPGASSAIGFGAIYVKPDGTLWGHGNLAALGWTEQGIVGDGVPVFLGYVPPSTKLQSASYGFFLCH